MNERTVKTQAELDQAVAEKVDYIEIRSPKGVWLYIDDLSKSSSVVARGSSSVVAWESSSVEAWGSSSVEARGSSSVEAWGSSSVVAWGSSSVVARGSSSVVARGSSSVVARESSSVEAWGSSSVEAWGSSSVEAWGSSSVEAWESSSVEAWGSSSVVARGSSSVVARESSSVVAWGSSSVVARESSSVVARESSSVVAWGSSSVVAGSHTAVHLHSSDVDLKGGVVIDHTKIDLTDAKTWCEYHGVKVTRGVATLYKAVGDNYTSPHGTSYAPGSKPSAPDWDDRDSCGGGLHFSPSPASAADYNTDASRYLEVGVRLSELRPITSGWGTPKCKAPRVARACVEVDRRGRRIEPTP